MAIRITIEFTGKLEAWLNNKVAGSKTGRRTVTVADVIKAELEIIRALDAGDEPQYRTRVEASAKDLRDVRAKILKANQDLNEGLETAYGYGLRYRIWPMQLGQSSPKRQIAGKVITLTPPPGPRVPKILIQPVDQETAPAARRRHASTASPKKDSAASAGRRAHRPPKTADTPDPASKVVPLSSKRPRPKS